MNLSRFKGLWDRSKYYRPQCERDWDEAGNTFAKYFLISIAVALVLFGLHGWFMAIFLGIKPLEGDIPVWIAVPRIFGMIGSFIAVTFGVGWLIAFGPPIACSLSKAWKKEQE